MTVGGVSRAVDVAGLPKLSIITDGGAPIVSKDDYVTATFTLSGPAPFTGTGQIKGRGNSTWLYGAKKPYRIKLGSAASLVPGRAADRDWVLLANYFDPSGIRNATATNIGNRCAGLPWAPQFQFVEVTLNGVPLGLYQLGEHVKVATARVNIDKPGAATTGLPLTGGYALEIDRRGYDEGDPGFVTTAGVKVVYDDPDDSVPAQAAYIAGWVQSFEDALMGSSWLDPATGYARFIDMPSFIDWYLVNELCANQDSTFYSSCKLYKTRDTATVPGKLYMGPLWDFDLSLHNNMFGIDDLPAEGFWTKTGATWIARMYTDPAFKAALNARWAALRTSLVTTAPIATFIDQAANRTAFATNRNLALWKTAVTANDTPASVKAWLSTRIAWLNTQFV